MLAYDYKNRESIAELEYIKQNFTLSKNSLDYIDSYLKQIKARDDLNFDIGLTFIHDTNVNQVTNEKEIIFGSGSKLTVPDRESATGFSYNTSLSKQVSQKYGGFIATELSSNGKIYFDNSKYNDLSSRLSICAGYKNYNLNIALNPFFEKRWYNNKPYQDKVGVNLYTSYRLTNKLRVSSFIEYAKNNYIEERKRLNGNSFFISGSASYSYNQYLNLNVSLSRNFEEAEDKSDQSNTYTKRIGIASYWTENFSTYASYSFSEKFYDATFFIFEKREDKNYKYNLSIKHNSIEFKGFIPKLVISYEQKKSNNPIYNYNNLNYFISIEKAF